MTVITVTSGNQDPANFSSNFANSIQLSENYEIALLKIAHGPLANISSKNNKLYLINKTTNSTTFLSIPTGHYKSSHDILIEIHNQLTTKAKDQIFLQHFDVRSTLRYKTSSSSEILTLMFTDTNINFYTDYSAVDNILFYLDFKLDNFSARTINVTNYDLRTSDKIGFVYSSIVSNSIIDSNQSRILDTIPLTTDDEYSFYEAINPVYHDMSVASFIDIEFQIRSVNGEFIHFSRYLPTILTLDIRKKQLL